MSTHPVKPDKTEGIIDSKMDDDNGLRTLIFTMTYISMRRRRDVNNVNIQRRNEIQRRVRHRQYFFQRQRRMLMMMTVLGGLRSRVRMRTRSRVRMRTRSRVPMRTRPWTRTQSTGWWERVMTQTEYQPSDWLNSFRMSRESFFYLCDRLRGRLTRQGTRLHPGLSVEKRVAMALWRLASSVEYRVISALFDVGRSTVRCCVRDLCQAIAAVLMPAYMRYPGDAELRDSAQLCQDRWGFPHCVGAVATLHTAIVTPSANPVAYCNPDGWMSVMTQVLIDGRGQFWDVCGSFPGGTEPAEVLQNSVLWASAYAGELSPYPAPLFMGRPLRYVLLGDGGHPLRPWLLTPYPGAPDGPRRLFNRRLEGARREAEEAMLRLRSRWQCLSKKNDYGLKLLPTMVLACCVLHNMCEAHGDSFLPEWREEVVRAETPQPGLGRPWQNAGEPGKGQAEEVRGLFSDHFQQLS